MRLEIIRTSNMLYIDPASADMRKAIKDYQPLPEGGARIMFTRDRQAAARGEAIYSPTGSWGDPTLATRNKGRIVTEATLTHVLQQIETLHQAAPPNTGAAK
jgi:creatinine amidohydrolase